MPVTETASRRGVLTLVYSVYAWTAFALLATGAVLGAAALPGLRRRRRWVSATARAFFRVAGIRAVVNGREHLPKGHTIVVANHASYLDGVILQAFLPPRFSYVIKREMLSVPVAGFLLRRIGSQFVERASASASARDARHLLRAAGRGETLGFFPEGTFRREVGLGRFRPGAFATAIRSESQLVPVVIRGSRQILPAGTLRAVRGPLEIDILEPIGPEHPAFAAPRSLGDAARQRMLAVLDEPDLAALSTPATRV